MFLAVVLGAFAAHGLQDRFGAYEKDIWGKANFYHFVHAIGLILVAILGRLSIISDTEVARIAGIMLAGLAVFSGSLYLLALTGYRALGMITPIGGTLMIVSWALLFFKARG
jgi:uncharacterized membrane protein YgdD (TMEM256/DUF423 family)